jgi:hypothetical protein
MQTLLPGLTPMASRAPVSKTVSAAGAATVETLTQAAAHTSLPIDADLDLFLRTRARVQGEQSLPGSLQLLLRQVGASPGKAVADDVGTALAGAANIYADGLVCEDEMSALRNISVRLSSVLQLQDKTVSAMLPRDVARRLEAHLFDPVRALLGAVKADNAALFAKIAERDDGALRARLQEPITFTRTSGEPPSHLNLKAGDRLLVPRSDGSVTMGVVSGRDKGIPPGVIVSMVDPKTGGFAQKTLTDEDIAPANPAKIGDTFFLNGSQVWITGADAHGITVTAELENGKVLAGDASLLAQVNARTPFERRQQAPVELRELDLSVLFRSGTALDSLARFRPGDFVSVPRSDGSFSQGIFLGEKDGLVNVEMMVGSEYGSKSLDVAQFQAANPLKIGDAFHAAGARVEVIGCGAGGLMGRVVRDGVATTVNSPELRRLGAHAMQAHGQQTVVLPAVQAMTGLTTDNQRQIASLLALKGDPVFGKLVDAVRALRVSKEFLQAAPSQQQMMLGELLRSEALLQVVTPNFGVARTNVAAVTVSEPIRERGNAYFNVKGPVPDAQVFTVTLRVGASKQEFRVVLPDSYSPLVQQQKINDVTSALKELPPEAVRGLKIIALNPERNPDDVGFAKQFNIPDFQSAMTANSATRQITVYNESVKRSLQSFTHEVGHFASYDLFDASGDAHKWGPWTTARRADLLSVSQYAMKNQAEDFAETFSLYMTTKGTARHDMYRNLMPERFAILDTL